MCKKNNFPLEKTRGSKPSRTRNPQLRYENKTFNNFKTKP